MESQIMSEVVATLEYDGKQYTIRDDKWTDPDDGGVYYQWVDGNYSCDCNRKLFIEYAYSDESPFEPDENGWYPCGETIKLVSLVLDGKDLLAPTVNERLAAIGLFSYGGL